jgi:dienelactone hydrolase
VPGVAEYHGGLLGASLWPVGTPLWGLQLYDNVRALDYLCSRPEVDAQRIGCTGASGGGNQTMYISAFDRRIRAAVPVCSVGNFQAYLGRACCVDEVMIGALTACEEGDLLGLVAPRALLVINATRDAPQFSVEEARKSVARARTVFDLYGAGERLRHRVVESGHDYNREMREAMYGWFERWLRDRGDGAPIPEPEGPLEEPEALRCFPSGERPVIVVPIVRFVEQQARRQVAGYEQPHGESGWRRWQERLAERLRGPVLRLPGPPPHPGSPPEPGTPLEPEPGIALPWQVLGGTAAPESPRAARPAVLALHPDGAAAAGRLPLARRLAEAEALVMTVDLRGTGASANPADALGEIPDHTLCEAALWVGRPLMGQWVTDVHVTVGALAAQPGVDPERLFVIGWREAGLLALIAAGLDRRIHGAAAIESLATYVTGSRPHGQRMVAMVPDLLRHADVPQLAALVAPRPAVLLNPLRADGSPARSHEFEQLSAWPRAAFHALGAPERFHAAARAAEDCVLEVFGLGSPAAPAR